jgi:hypothetical protein
VFTTYSALNGVQGVVVAVGGVVLFHSGGKGLVQYVFELGKDVLGHSCELKRNVAMLIGSAQSGSESHFSPRA